MHETILKFCIALAFFSVCHLLLNINFAYLYLGLLATGTNAMTGGFSGTSVSGSITNSPGLSTGGVSSTTILTSTTNNGKSILTHLFSTKMPVIENRNTY